jgi:Protein of unknown function (DUF5661)
MPAKSGRKTNGKSRTAKKTRSKSRPKPRARATKARTKPRSKSKTIRKKRVTLQETRKIGNKLKVDFTALDIKVLQCGMNVELEHGYIDSRTNVTNNNLILTAKIALAHIVEFPDYYARLKKMEEEGEKYWKNRKKINPFKN